MAIPTAAAGQYLGEYCWTAHTTQDEDGATDNTVTGRWGVTHMGGAYYLVQGKMNTGDEPLVLNGTAVIDGNEIIVSAQMTQDHSPRKYRDTGAMQLRLNATTLNGTFWSNGLGFDTEAREWDHFYSSGTATVSACP